MNKSTQSACISILYLLLFMMLPQVALAMASELRMSDITRGSLFSNDATGNIIEIPQIDTAVDAYVTGPIARTHMTQTFINPSDEWVEALYLFPLPEDAAVDRLKMYVGDRVIEGEIQQRQQAKKTYEKAKKEGKRTALVEQDRPNIFSTSVANIPPHGTVKVEIEFQQSLAWRDGKFTWRFPLAITPRFSREQLAPKYEIDSELAIAKGWQVLPNERPQVLDLDYQKQALPPVTMKVTLNPGFELADITSRYHAIKQNQGKQGTVEVSLSEPESAANRDFVLSWAPARQMMPTAAFFSEQRQDGQYALMMLTPPKIENWSGSAREITFIIDTSGSMSGQSIRAAKRALNNGLSSLAPNDSFNIVEFNSDAFQLFSMPKPVTAYNLLAAKSFVDSLEARGGTEMMPALTLALKPTHKTDKLKQVVFITDGSVSNESEVFKLIKANLRDSRLFTVAIGSAPNSYLMKEAAVIGGGSYTYISTPNEAEAMMTALFDKLSQPALVNIKVSGNGVSDITPQKIPDLYSDEPLVVAMKLAPNTKELYVSGQAGHTLWKQKVTLQTLEQQSGIAIDWARKVITDLQRSVIYGDKTKEEITKAITEYALHFHLVSPYTSLVAVDVTPVRNLSENVTQKAMPTPKPQGLQIMFAQGAAGYETSLLLGLMLLLLWVVMRRFNGKFLLQC